MRRFAILFSFILVFFKINAQNDFYIKEVIFSEDADSVTKIEMASRLIPTSKQLDWQNLELTAFLHFGINTFTDKEWGNGSESPAIFNPTDLDADQWVKVLKEAGFRMIILTAKHHDGFCLWPTATTSHSVKSSPWRNGEGDVMRELSEACHRYGMKLGVYLSPWDRNAPCYGDSEKYNDMFVEQLKELLTYYGKIDEVWFDGACGEGPNGRKQQYDWTRYKETIETLQPDAVLAIMGDDVRWVGNEKGQGRDTEWSVTALVPGIYPNSAERNSLLDLKPKSPDLGSRRIIAKATSLYWWPSEVDVSIRPGWFWHEHEAPKSLRQLAEIYLNSIGKNSVLLLNIPPDRTGKIDSKDQARLMEFKQWLDSWEKRQSNNNDFINCVVLQEDITQGQRIEEFELNALYGGEWNTIAQGTTIGRKRILTFDPVKADSIELKIISSRGTPHLLPMEMYYIVLPEENAMAIREYLSHDNWKTIKSDDVNIEIDLGNQTSFSGFTYNPGNINEGLIFKYQFSVSSDGKNWNEIIADGEFGNIENNPVEQYVKLPKNISARYIRFSIIEKTGKPLLNNFSLTLFE